MAWWQYILIGYGILSAISIIVTIIEIKKAPVVPQEIDIYDL